MNKWLRKLFLPAPITYNRYRYVDERNNIQDIFVFVAPSVIADVTFDESNLKYNTLRIDVPCGNKNLLPISNAKPLAVGLNLEPFTIIAYFEKYVTFGRYNIKNGLHQVWLNMSPRTDS